METITVEPQQCVTKRLLPGNNSSGYIDLTMSILGESLGIRSRECHNLSIPYPPETSQRFKNLRESWGWESCKKMFHNFPEFKFLFDNPFLFKNNKSLFVDTFNHVYRSLSPHGEMQRLSLMSYDDFFLYTCGYKPPVLSKGIFKKGITVKSIVNKVIKSVDRTQRSPIQYNKRRILKKFGSSTKVESLDLLNEIKKEIEYYLTYFDCIWGMLKFNRSTKWGVCDKQDFSFSKKESKVVEVSRTASNFDIVNYLGLRMNIKEDKVEVIPISTSHCMLMATVAFVEYVFIIEKNYQWVKSKLDHFDLELDGRYTSQEGHYIGGVELLKYHLKGDVVTLTGELDKSILFGSEILSLCSLEERFDTNTASVIYNYTRDFWKDNPEVIDNAINFVLRYNTASKSKAISTEFNWKRKRYCNDISYLRDECGYPRLYYYDEDIKPTTLAISYFPRCIKEKRNFKCIDYEGKVKGGQKEARDKFVEMMGGSGVQDLIYVSGLCLEKRSEDFNARRVENWKCRNPVIRDTLPIAPLKDRVKKMEMVAKNSFSKKVENNVNCCKDILFNFKKEHEKNSSNIVNKFYSERINEDYNRLLGSISRIRSEAEKFSEIQYGGKKKNVRFSGSGNTMSSSDEEDVYVHSNLKPFDGLKLSNFYEVLGKVEEGVSLGKNKLKCPDDFSKLDFPISDHLNFMRFDFQKKKVYERREKIDFWRGPGRFRDVFCGTEHLVRDSETISTRKKAEVKKKGKARVLSKLKEKIKRIFQKTVLYKKSQVIDIEGVKYLAKSYKSKGIKEEVLEIPSISKFVLARAVNEEEGPVVFSNKPNCLNIEKVFEEVKNNVGGEVKLKGKFGFHLNKLTKFGPLKEQEGEVNSEIHDLLYNCLKVGNISVRFVTVNKNKKINLVKIPEFPKTKIEFREDDKEKEREEEKRKEKGKGKEEEETKEKGGKGKEKGEEKEEKTVIEEKREVPKDISQMTKNERKEFLKREGKERKKKEKLLLRSQEGNKDSKAEKARKKFIEQFAWQLDNDFLEDWD